MDQTSEFKGLILLNKKRIAIPKKARENTLKELHSSHQGIDRTKRRTRNTVYWPNIVMNITKKIKNC